MKRFISMFFSLLIVFTVVFSTGAFANSVSDTPKEAIAVAQSSFLTIKSVFSTDYEGWGFSSSSEVASLELGKSYSVWYPDETKLQTEKGSNISDYVDNNRDVWIFTLDSEGVTKGFMWILKENNEYVMARYSGPDEVYLQMKLTAERIAEENDLDILPVFFNNFGTLNFVLQSESAEYVLPVENAALSRTTQDYDLSSITHKENMGYLLSSKDYTDRLKVMYRPNKSSTNVEDYKYAGVSIYDIPSENVDKNHTDIIIIAAVLVLILAMIVIFTISRTNKKPNKKHLNTTNC